MTKQSAIRIVTVIILCASPAFADRPNSKRRNTAPTSSATTIMHATHELYVAGADRDDPAPPAWPGRVVVEPGQRLALRVPTFAAATSTDPELVAVRPDGANGLIHITASAGIAAAGKPVSLSVKVDAKTSKTIPVVVRPDIEKDLRELLKGLEGLTVAKEAGYVVVRGPLLERSDRTMLDRILALFPGVLDFTSDAVDAPDKMIEIDVVIVVVNDRIVKQIGFNFLESVQFHFDIFQTTHRRAPIGNLRPVPLDPSIGAPTVLHKSQWGETLSAAIDYNVNIANTLDEGSKVIARPHLVTLNGQSAEFHAGGEIAFRLTGVQTAELELYERGIILNVTPTLLRPVRPGGKPKILVDAEVIRISTNALLFDGATGGDVDFDKTRISSKTILEMDQTLVLSGIYQREYRKQNDGVPVLRDIPGLKMFFARAQTLQDVVSTIVFLTPRAPGYVDQASEDATAEFVERRRKYIEARNSGDPDKLAAFKADHPDWMKPQPNRYATHFFLRDNSTVYRELRGEDLSQEELQYDVLNVPTAAGANEGTP